jgi:queuine tRNA-ribosyltransferase
MPVGTLGSVKGVSPEELKNLGAQIVLSNTYHLYLRPGEKTIKKLGGLHEFMQWDKPILTDSGGYQVFSLGKDNAKFLISNDKSNHKSQITNVKTSLVKVTENGVEFKSHLDGAKHLFTPEKVIQIQLDLGVDILMPLDVCPSGKATKEEVKRAVDLTVRWAKRSKDYFDKQISNSKFLISNKNSNDQMTNDKLMENGKWKMENDQRPLLHGIVQGGMFPDLRIDCAEKLIAMNFDGYSVGGLAVDLETRDMWKIVKLIGEILPENKQRYLMGVGTPDDIIKATSLGMDMFDCVLPTRMARHGSVYTKNPKSEIRNPKQILNFKIKNYKLINLLNSQYREDGGVIDEKCGCPACAGPLAGGFSKAYISHLIRSNEILGLRLATLHNLWQYLALTQQLRENI